MNRTLDAAPGLQPLITPTLGSAGHVPIKEPVFATHLEQSISDHETDTAYASTPVAAPSHRAAERSRPDVSVDTMTPTPIPAAPAPTLHASSLSAAPPRVPAHMPPSFEIVGPEPASRHAARREDIDIPAHPAVVSTGKSTPASPPMVEHEQEIANRAIRPTTPPSHQQTAHALTLQPQLDREGSYQVRPLPASAMPRTGHEVEPETARPDEIFLSGLVRPAVIAEFDSKTDQRMDQRTRSASTTAPTIRVNIGRIEVRAIAPATAPAAPRQRARPGPLLSLEDYLRQRNGRSR